MYIFQELSYGTDVRGVVKIGNVVSRAGYEPTVLAILSLAC